MDMDCLRDIEVTICDFYNQGRLEASIQFINKALSTYPHSANLLFWAAKIYKELGQVEQAESYLSQAISNSNKDPIYCILLAFTLSDADEWEQAFLYFEKTYELLSPDTYQSVESLLPEVIQTLTEKGEFHLANQFSLTRQSLVLPLP
jgi:tetratricopeptide (TPR) repeat protein